MTRLRNTWATGILSLAFALGGCDSGDGDEGGGDDAAVDDGSADDDGVGDDGATLRSFEADVAPIVAANCSCHRSATPAAGLDLTDDAAYDSLVDAQASVAMNYVTPGDPQASYLLHKLDGTQADVGGAGARMPLNGALGDADIETIEGWIEDGAEP